MIQERSQPPIRDCFERVPLGLTVERDFYLTDAAALLFRRGKRRKGKGGKKKKKVNGPMDPSSRGPSPPRLLAHLAHSREKYARLPQPGLARKYVIGWYIRINLHDEMRGVARFADDEDREIFEGRKMLILCFFFLRVYICNSTMNGIESGVV